MKSQHDNLQYRYPGVTPFTTGQSHIFFGREQDTIRLLKQVQRQSLTILYGKSGLGKSSLINAGLIPAILEEGVYAPIVIRFGAWTETAATTPIDLTKESIKENDEANSFLSKLIPQDNSLWFHAKNRQLNDGGKPLLLFDQFEELFSYPDSAIADFQQEIAELVHTGIPLRFRRKLEAADNLSEEEEDQLEAPLDTRILFAIRSDRLHLLDRLKDYLPNILRHTYELKALSIKDAKNAIILPAQMEGNFHTPPFSFSQAALDKLIDFLKEEEQSGEGLPSENKQRIEGILIQMLCEHYERNQIQKEGHRQLDLLQIGDPNKVVINYYDEKINALAEESRLAARHLIEDGLVSEGEGMRLSLHEAFIFQKYQVEKELLEKLVDNRLLRSEPFLRGGYSYELSHDRLVPAVMDARARRREAEAEMKRQAEAHRLKQQAEQERLEKEKAKKQLRTVRGLLVFAIIALVSAVAGLLYANNQKNAAEASELRSRNLYLEVQEKDSLNRIEKLNRYMAEAKSLQDQGKYTEAIDKYEFSKEFTDDSLSINQAIEACLQAAGNLVQFNELMDEAHQLSDKKNYSGAILNYQKAIDLRVNPLTIRIKLQELKAILNEEARKARTDAEAYRQIEMVQKAALRQREERQFNLYISQIDNLLSEI